MKTYSEELRDENLANKIKETERYYEAIFKDVKDYDDWLEVITSLKMSHCR